MAANLWMIAAAVICLACPAQARDDATLASAVLTEINTARSSPAYYARLLKTFRQNYQGKNLYLPGTRSRIVTREGTTAVDEAVAFLSKQKPLPLLSFSPGLTKAAQELVRDQGRTGGLGHTGNSNSSPRERIERQGSWGGRIAENIYYGPGDARLVVMQLIIDDGVPDRGHRKNIFERALREAGVACGPHPELDTVCVTDFASRFTAASDR